jgi:ankyrin repeat protein
LSRHPIDEEALIAMKPNRNGPASSIAVLLVVSLCSSACFPLRWTNLEGAPNQESIRQIEGKAELRERFGPADAATTDGRFELYSLRKEAEWSLETPEGDLPLLSREVGTTHVLFEFDGTNRTAATHFQHCDDDSHEALCLMEPSEVLFALIGELRGPTVEARQFAAEPQYAALAERIHAAAASGSLGAVQDLIANGASISSHVGGMTPAHRAAQAGQAETLAYLIGAGVPIDVRTGTTWRTPLHLAASNGQLDCVDWLLARGAEPDPVDMARSTPVRDAVRAGEVAVAMRLIDVGADVNARPGDLLIMATQHGNFALVESLVDHGADVDSKGGLISGRPSLYYAVEQGMIDIASLLLESGANLTAGPESYDPLHTAVDQRDIAMVRLLLEYGANPNKRVRFPGQGAVTATERARLRGDEEVADLLAEYGDRG